MSDKLVRIKNRYDTYENWVTENPVLAAGEIGIDNTNNIIKVGNGIDNWYNLQSHGIYCMKDNNESIFYGLLYNSIVSMACGYTAMNYNNNEFALNPMKTYYIKGQRTDINTPPDKSETGVPFVNKLYFHNLTPNDDNYEFVKETFLNNENPEYDEMSCFYNLETAYDIRIKKVRIELIGYESIEVIPEYNYRIANKYELRSCTDANENTKIYVYIGTHSVIFPSSVKDDICIYIER